MVEEVKIRTELILNGSILYCLPISKYNILSKVRNQLNLEASILFTMKGNTLNQELEDEVTVSEVLKEGKIILKQISKHRK